MKIAVFGLSETFGGVERYIDNMYNALRKCNINFYFFTNANNIRYIKLNSEKDKIIYYPSRRSHPVQSFKFLNSFFATEKIDAIWFNCCTLSDIMPLILAKKYKVKKRIIHSHNSENMGSKLTMIFHIFNKMRIPYICTDFVACSELAADFMYPVKRVKIKFIKNAIECQKYTYDPEKSKNVKTRNKIDGYPIVGHVGRFHEQKNHRFLIDVFCEILNKFQDAKLILCGDGPLKQDIESYVIEKGIDANVIFTGNISNIEDIYQVFDIFIFPSKYEGLPFALIEAQAAGIPCLVSDAISKEVAITKLVHFKSLNNSTKEWGMQAEQLLHMAKENTFYEMSDLGYDIDSMKRNILSILEITS